MCNVVVLPCAKQGLRKFTEEKEHACTHRKRTRRRKEGSRAAKYISRRVQGMFLSGVISMGIGGTLLRLTVSYLKYIFVDGAFIDMNVDTALSAAIDNIFPVSGREASFPVASPMKKPASQSQPIQPLSYPPPSPVCFGLQLTYGLLHASLHLAGCV